MYIPVRPGRRVRRVRQLSYSVLCQNYPQRLTANEIAESINIIVNSKFVSADQVRYAIRYFALRNKHFAVFRINQMLKFSVYILDPPFDAWQD